MRDFLIIGGGVIGMMTALQLADAGQQVTLVDRGECGKEASWAGAVSFRRSIPGATTPQCRNSPAGRKAFTPLWLCAC
ncbi:hypothetical protein HORIV_57610 [Vreelandella olivaria]|uniref:FAD dependent oxidoreductase domain-containing protein n=1 Tax=Vreelandella olivaria TaxID=390919 RepID=A0ABM7GRK0_9GAMM|nr:hypothetical protein HORIV_57610 [Halomonas olivaria]